ncbi:MAG: GLPGLI family protein [Salibacteraceae bacterium]|jgi:GLPGLI family protein
MKNLFLILFFTVSFQAFSQVTEGYFQYSIDVKPLDTSIDTRQKVGMLIDSKMEIYFADNLSRVDFQMGSMYTTSVRIDRNIQKAISLSTSMAGNYAAELPMDALNANAPQLDPNAVLELFDEEKTILGFKCKKAVLTQDGNSTIYWVTDEIDIAIQNYSILNPNVPGFPLEFSSTSEGMSMNFKASNHKLNLKDKKEIFSTVIPEEYALTPQNTSGQ